MSITEFCTNCPRRVAGLNGEPCCKEIGGTPVVVIPDDPAYFEYLAGTFEDESVRRRFLEGDWRDNVFAGAHVPTNDNASVAASVPPPGYPVACGLTAAIGHK